MSTPESRSSTIAHAFLRKRITPDEANRIIEAQSKLPNRKIVCIKNGSDGKPAQTTRVPFLHRLHKMEGGLDNLFYDMLAADVVIVRGRK